MRAERGFTLIEMLVALAVFSLTVLALLNLAGENTRTAHAVEVRALAGIVAENRAVEAVVLDERTLRAARAGEELLAGRAWRWTREVADTADAAILRVEIRVEAADAAGTVAAERVVFRSRGA
ncbi:type II secretion system minor pseudopilin GspI [Coralloluteibacterium thermophilus]|uniref:Type II secretion system protein I n=1 Tax=Coralloluteibacterium thermophilum TaxID=2707049 RepID=A0ABV9NKE0_9GAMM